MKSSSEHNTHVQSLQQVTLRADKKAAMRAELETYADFNQVPEGVRIPVVDRLPWYTQLSIALNSVKQQRMIKVGIMMAVLVTTGGATSIAAQGAVPGDTLYPLKVHVNENVRGAVAIGTNAEARHQGRVLAERVTEAEILLERGGMTEEQAEAMRARIEARAAVMSERSAQADATVQAEVRADVMARLAALEERIATRGDAAAVSITAGLERARAAVQQGGAGDAAADAQLESVIETEARVQQARQSLETAAEISSDVQVELGSKLDTAARSAANARADIEADARATVQESLDAAATLLEEVEVELRTRGGTSGAAGAESRGAVNEPRNGRATTGAETGVQLDVGGDVDSDAVQLEAESDVRTDTDVQLRL